MEAAFVAAIAAFAGWQALSAVWSLVPGDAVREAERGLVYVAAALAFAAVARGDGGLWLLIGVLVGGAGVCAYSLARRAIEPADEVPFQGTLLSEPLGYANALGLLAALVLVIAVGLAFTVRSRLERACLAAAVPISVAALALTSSRGSWFAAGLGLSTLVVFRASTSARIRGAWLVAQALVLAGILTSPLALDLTTLEARLSERPYYWWTAWHAFADRPSLGWGAGTFDELWAARAPIPSAVRDVHSVYVEALVELGPVGLALITLALFLPAAVAASAPANRAGAAAAGAYVTFLVHAGLDWDWEMPAVTLAGLACGAAILIDGRRGRPAGAAADHLVLAAAVLLLGLGTLSFVLGR